VASAADAAHHDRLRGAQRDCMPAARLRLVNIVHAVASLSGELGMARRGAWSSTAGQFLGLAVSDTNAFLSF
jgi:hypothetical protein